MLAQSKKISPIERWLRKNNMTMMELAEKVGCHRETIRRVKEGIAIEEQFARAIYFATGGYVDPAVKRRGRPSCEQLPQP